MRRLEDRLREKDILSEELINTALKKAAETHRHLAVVLLEDGFVPEGILLPVLAEHHGLRLVSIESYKIDASAVKAIPAKIAVHYKIMPLKLEDDTLTIGVYNPADLSPSEDIEANFGFRVERVLAPKREIMEALRKYYGVGAETVERILADTDLSLGGGYLYKDETQDLEKAADDASVIKLVNQLVQEAIQDNATDIHFEALRDGVSIRRRIDGILFETSVPRNIRLLYQAIVTRLKLMAGLDIVERRLPQDGKARVKIGNREYDLRISIVPAIHGEDVVIRILPAAMLFDLGQLGFSETHLKALEKYLSKPYGIIFITGPTGSGKSTTLYACLNKLNSREKKIITIEDPVEYELRGLIQTQINPSIGLTFARALRSMLRHDPDIMMVGEVRDKETAEIAIQTAMTGHLVLSTLHTNDAASAAVRLMDMGIDPYLIASTVHVFIAQRLVRSICSNCKEKAYHGNSVRYRGRGCRMCRNTGYSGRVAICERVEVTDDVRELILKRATAAEIRRAADAAGLETLAADGFQKVEAGITTEEEILRVTFV